MEPEYCGQPKAGYPHMVPVTYMQKYLLWLVNNCSTLSDVQFYISHSVSTVSLLLASLPYLGICTCIRSICIYVYLHMYKHIHVKICIYMSTYSYVYKYTYICKYIHMCLYMYLYFYLYMYMYLYMYISGSYIYV